MRRKERELLNITEKRSMIDTASQAVTAFDMLSAYARDRGDCELGAVLVTYSDAMLRLSNMIEARVRTWEDEDED